MPPEPPPGHGDPTPPPKAPEPPREQYVTDIALNLNNGAEDFLKKHHEFTQDIHHPQHKIKFVPARQR